VIRVGFIINFRDEGWLGGINYFLNLFNAICSISDRKIEPIIFTGYKSNREILKSFPNGTIIQDRLFDSFYPNLQKVLKALFHHDFLLENLLKKNNIQVLSHSGTLARKSVIPTIGWITDFQHKYLPYFFSKNELLERDQYFETICRDCNAVIFSSNTAKDDAIKFYPKYSKKFRVLQFSIHMNLDQIPDFTTLAEKYQIHGPYLIVPNQFWIHKNHRVILEALKKLKMQGHSITIIATGETSDFRQPDYFYSIKKTILDYDISQNFRVLGMIPYNDLICLMLHSIAVINPSLFEGWSTTVEEAKALNFLSILSDIPVHREQNPEQGVFFPPTDSDRLADIILMVSQTPRRDTTPEEMIKIRKNLRIQKCKFGEKYQKIILEIVNQQTL